MMKKIIGVITVVLVALSSVVLFPSVCMAENTICDDLGSDDPRYELAGCQDTKKADEIAFGVIQVVLSLMGLIAIGVMVYGGVTMMVSTGDAARVQKGRRIIIYGLVGLIVAMSSFMIVTFAGKAFQSSYESAESEE